MKFQGFSQRLPAGVLSALAILIAVTNMYASSGLGGTPPPAQAPAPHVPPYGGLPPQGRQPREPRQPGRPPHGGRGRGRVAAVIVTCAVVAGGAFAVTEAVSGSSPNLTPASSTAVTSGAAGQAAVLNGVLADAASATPTAGTPATKAAAVRRLGRALVRLRLLGGIHGEYTFQTKSGPRTLAFERGTVLSAAGSDVTVRATDGTTWTWVLTSTSIVREDGSRTTAKSLAAGQLVFAAGPVTGTTRDARLIVIRNTAKPQQS